MSVNDNILGLRRFAERVDRPALAAILGLLLASLVTLYSVTHAPVPEAAHQVLDVGEVVFWRQIAWITVGLLAM